MGGCLAKEDSSNSRGSAVVPYSSPPANAKKKARLRLYATEICPVASSIRIALEFKGIEVQVVWLNADDERARSKQLLHYMLPADEELPILQHDDRIISASQEDILAYLEAAFPKPSLRSGKASKKEVQNWIDFARDSFAPTILKALYNSGFAPQLHGSYEKLLDASFAKLNAGIAKHASKGPFFLGSHFSLVDVHLIPLLALLRPLAYTQGIEMSPDYSHLRSYGTRISGFAGYAPVRMDEDMVQEHVYKVLERTAPPPMVAMAILQHQSMLQHLEHLVLALEEIIGRLIVASSSSSSSSTRRIITTDPAKGSIAMQMKKLSARYASLLEVMLEHAQMEERLIFPPLDKADRDITSSANQSHARHLPLMNGIKEDFKAVVSFEQGSPGLKETLQVIASRLRTLQDQNVEHFREEEAELLPLLQAAGLGSKQQAALLGKSMEMMESTHGHKFPFLLSGLQPHQIHRYLNLLHHSLPQSEKHVLLKRLMSALKQASEEEEYSSVWQSVKCRVPLLAAIASDADLNNVVKVVPHQSLFSKW